jgi:adenylosuccinate lyase
MKASKNIKELGLENNLLELIAKDKSFNLTIKQLKTIMNLSIYIGRSIEQVEEYLKEYIKPILKKNFN